MRLFSFLYQKALLWSQHVRAPYYLAVVSFAESSFFPIPPDVMLIPMGLAKPDKARWYAFITTLFSVLGGILGYVLGSLSIDLLYPYLVYLNIETSYLKVTNWFDHYGIWVLLCAGFIPVPYKLFTLAAGAMKLAFMPFLLASIVARSIRFFIVSTILHHYGEGISKNLHKHIDLIGWLLVLIVMVAFILIKLN